MNRRNLLRDQGREAALETKLFRSAPAQNVSPLPVSMATYCLSSSRKSVQAAINCSAVSWSIAFFCSGRLIVIVVIWFCFVTSIFDIDLLLLPYKNHKD